MSYSPAATLSATGVTPTRPETVFSRFPLKPALTSNDLLPLALASPCTSVGAATATGRTATGLRTVWPAPVQVRDPTAQSPKPAVVRVKVTVNVPSPPGASVSVDGLTTVVKPGRLADAVYVA